MKKIKVMPVFGTRPDAIKMAPLVKELEKNPNIETVTTVTGQHREMLDQVLEIFDITPAYDLKIMKKSQTLEYITESILNKLGDVLDKEKPDLVLVHGDTTTCFVSALTAFYRQIPVGHVEAGLRTNDIYSPFPEEMNRKLVGSIASIHFCPTINNKNNLLKENIDESNIFVTGNTVIDALQTTVKKEYSFNEDILNTLDYSKKIVTVTAHRRENLGKPLENICQGIKTLASENKDAIFVYPVHLNPAVQNTAKAILGNLENVVLINPIDVSDLHNLMKRSYMVMTDSGGLQEEAPSLGTPVLVLRSETERPEAVAAGTVKLTGTNYDDIVSDGRILFKNSTEYKSMSNAVNPYGDGFASKRITDIILNKMK